MNDKPRANWFRFSLRTLFVLVTILCVWLGWQLNIVRERRLIRTDWSASSKFQFMTAESYDTDFSYGPVATATIPLPRRLMGDEAIQLIWYSWYQPPSDEEVQRIADAFPEATISQTQPEPCHPGCFPRGTLVLTPDGERSIETIRPGDAVTTFDAEGMPVETAVQSVFATDNRIWRVETEDGVLFTTQTQPLCVAADKTRQAGDLQVGDEILRRIDGEKQPSRVQGVSATKRIEKVFNLILGDSQIFVAGGYLAQSKPPANAGAFETVIK